MVYVYGIETQWKKLISEYFNEFTVIDFRWDGHYHSSTDNDNESVVISSYCTEDERKKIKQKLSGAHCVVFFEDYAKFLLESNKAISNDFEQVFIADTHWIDSLQIPVAKHCNLRCNRCYHFSNLVKEEFYPFLEYENDLLSLKNLNVNIGEIRFLGGEPLLNKKILDYIEYTRQLYPYSVIKIITNGLLVKEISQSDWKRLIQLKVVISISVYPPLEFKLEALEEYLKKMKAFYEIFRVGTHFEKVLLRNPNLDDKKTADECGKCVIIYRGNIGRCAAGMFISDFNSYFNMNYPDNNFASIDYFETSSDLVNYLDRGVPLCHWCVGDERIESFSWSNSFNMTVDDYIINN